MPENGYRLTDYEYELPEQFIAQEPFEPRDHCKLMALDRKTGAIRHQLFYEISEHLSASDILVVNETRVFPARLLGVKPSGGQIDMLLLEQIDTEHWKALVRPARRFNKGNFAAFGEKAIRVQVVEELEKGQRLVQVTPSGETLFALLEKVGHTPLPPYIRRADKPEDRANYQTIYSKNRGSVAAPTAGFHFTEALFEKLREKGVTIVPLTLHIGLGTFRPVDCDDIRDYQIHSEYYEIPEDSRLTINAAKKHGQRIVAVGTTSVRTLESAANPAGEITKSNGWTKLFIYPGYQFKITDAIITNFHLPKSSLLMMISAFSSLPTVRHAYEEAKRLNYRFFSYGDAMFLH